jgi:hypothetical protein
MQLSKAPASLLDIVSRDNGLADLATLTDGQKSDLFRKLGAVQQVLNAAYGAKGVVVVGVARSLQVSKQSVHGWVNAFNKHGFRGLIDGRKAAAKGRAYLPEVTRQWIKDMILRTQRNDAVLEVRRQALDQWNLWRRTGDPQWMIPGYMTPPMDSGKGYPAGWSGENFRRCSPTAFQASLARQGTISATRQLPSILSTRVGSRYLETIFFDDQKYDVQIRVPGFEKPMVPLGFNALDHLTAFAFAPHIRLRWFDAETGVHKSLSQKEYVCYVLTILTTEGYRTDEAGTTLVQEHGTAKTWANQSLSSPGGFHSFEAALKSLTGCRMDSSGLFNKAAFSELLYGPKSSGNPRFKAPIESFFHLVRTYMLPLLGQTGRNPDEAPEETYGIDQYERRMLKAALELPKPFQEALLSNYLTGIEFGQIAMLIYEALNNRTEHSLEGWSGCNFFEPVWRWAEDEPGRWRSRSELVSLPAHLREHAIHQQSQDAALTDLLRMSPAMAREISLHDPCIKRLRLEDWIHLIPTTWFKPVTFRNNHEIHLTDELLPGEELIYLPELTTPSGRTEYLRAGDQVMVFLNPLMPDTLLVCDQSFAFIGTLTRNIRVGRSEEQLEAMFRQRSRLKTALEAPVRRAMQPVADRRDAVRQLNADLIDQAKTAGLTQDAPPTAREQNRAATRRDNRAVKFGRAVAASRPQEACTNDADEAEDWTSRAAPLTPESSQPEETESW